MDDGVGANPERWIEDHSIIGDRFKVSPRSYSRSFFPFMMLMLQSFVLYLVPKRHHFPHHGVHRTHPRTRQMHCRSHPSMDSAAIRLCDCRRACQETNGHPAANALSTRFRNQGPESVGKRRRFVHVCSTSAPEQCRISNVLLPGDDFGHVGQPDGYVPSEHRRVSWKNDHRFGIL